MMLPKRGGGELGARLRELRRAQGITLQALAAELGVHFTTISAWERGRSAPDYAQLARLADRFRVRIGELLGETSSSKPRLRVNAWGAGRWKEYMNRTEALQLARAVLESPPGAAGCGPETVAGTLRGERPTLADLLRVAACYEVEGVEAPPASPPGYPTAEERIRAHLRHLPPELKAGVEALLLEWLDLFRSMADYEKVGASGGRLGRRGRRGLPHGPEPGGAAQGSGATPATKPGR